MSTLNMDGQIIQLLKMEGSLSTAEVAQYLGCNRDTAIAVMSRLKNHGVLEKFKLRAGKSIARGKLGIVCFYRLTKNELEVQYD